MSVVLLISWGHPTGATGLAQCVELTWQLRGTAGARQVEGAWTASQSALRRLGLPLSDNARVRDAGIQSELPGRRLLRGEVLAVLAVSLGASALVAAAQLIADLTRGRPLSGQHAVVVGSLAPGRPLIDLMFQLVDIAVALAPVALVVHLLHRDEESLATIGADNSEFRRDLVRGGALAAVVGGSGLAFYLGMRAAGLNLTVVAESLPAVWWRIPVLLLSAAQNAILEEVVVVGYLLRRLDQMGWDSRKALGASALLRGSYHLYQGFGGFAGNAVMGLVFGRLYQRWGRVAPLVVAHTLIDAVAFVGYALIHGRVSWLP